MSDVDPIRNSYYEPVERGEQCFGALFYFGALLSFATLLVDRDLRPELYEAVMVTFVVVVIALFAVGLVLRLYLTPRAETKRRQDFLGNAFGVSIIHQQTNGYYNNDCKDPIKRMAAQVLENSLFSKTIALRMARSERIKIAIYAVLWLVILQNRRTDIGWVVAASQAIFSEQILAKWLRLEWLRTRFERTFDDVYKLFQTRPVVPVFTAQALDAFALYETAKANAAIVLSSKHFDKVNASLSSEWSAIKARLNL